MSKNFLSKIDYCERIIKYIIVKDIILLLKIKFIKNYSINYENYCLQHSSSIKIRNPS